MYNDLLFEIGTEELPSGAVWPLAKELADNLSALLAEANLQYGEIRPYATPRRLAVAIENVQSRQESQSILRKGPATTVATDQQGKPNPALVGFAKSCGVSVEELSIIKTSKGEWWSYQTVKTGMDTCELLPEIINKAVASLTIPKTMRWGAGEVEFARPVHWVLLLFADQLVSANVLGLMTSQYSKGHRYHANRSIEISSIKQYESLLVSSYVQADFFKRRQLIVQQITQLAASQACTAVMPDKLIDEVTSIVEWPQALLASFDHSFLDVPAEVLIAAMQGHQKCFAMQDAQGQLVPHFITVANIHSNDYRSIILGNEKVMRARLSDAAFFYQQDKKKPLISYQQATEKVIFQKGLGSLYDKSKRLEKLLLSMSNTLGLLSMQAARAAELSKCDLMTGMVDEFPELQGVMGYYYALGDGEDEVIAQALVEQYLPRFAADSLPATPLGIALSLVDRLDTLVGNFSLGQKPTGVKDPFKLRRHALAVVRLLMIIPAPLTLSSLITQTLDIFGDRLNPEQSVISDLKLFILERMQSFYQGQGIQPELIQAVRAKQDDWLYDLNNRLNALLAFTKLPEAVSLSAASKRVKNLLQHASCSFDHLMVDPQLFQLPAESILLHAVEHVEQQVNIMNKNHQYGDVLIHLAGLKVPTDEYFDQVMIMVEDERIKSNRLATLARLQGLLLTVADISMLQLG
ncbi:MAG: glycine--tRNA ligase subunit beta [Legionella sp.]